MFKIRRLWLKVQNVVVGVLLTIVFMTPTLANMRVTHWLVIRQLKLYQQMVW